MCTNAARTFLATTLGVILMASGATAYAQPQEPDDEADDEIDVEVEDEADAVVEQEEAVVEEDEEDEVEVRIEEDEPEGVADLGFILGYRLDADDHGVDAFRVGLDGRFGASMGDELNLVFNPVVQITPSQITDEPIFDTALNILVEVVAEDVAFYFGPGLPLLVNFGDENDFDTVTAGINGIAGVRFDFEAAAEPFAQIRYHRVHIGDGPNTWIAEIGVHF